MGKQRNFKASFMIVSQLLAEETLLTCGFREVRKNENTGFAYLVMQKSHSNLTKVF